MNEVGFAEGEPGIGIRCVGVVVLGVVERIGGCARAKRTWV